MRMLSTIGIALVLAFTGVAGPTAAAPVEPSDDQTEVTVGEGRYRGAISGDLISWKGIRYGMAPTGEDRFQPPRPARPFTGTRTAWRAGAPCPQITPILPPPLNQLASGSREDCLFLNVFRPRGPRPAGGFPVLVFVPGGAYMLGDGAGYDPRPLVEQGRMIVVTLNYRLGPLGFLTLPATDREQPTGTSGNWGLMDQQLALRWVRRNATAFGGNPDLVTLSGQSAGGNSVCQHLASPLSRGLFQRAIVASGACVGSPLGPFPKRTLQRSSAQFARSMGCTDPARYLPCLREVSAAKLVSGPTTAFDNLDPTWVPAVDGHVIREPIADAYRAGRGARVPVMVGSTRNEGTLFTTLLHHFQLDPVTERSYQRYLKETFGPDADLVAARYRSDRLGSPSLALSATSTDRLFACPARWTAQALARQVDRVWAYELDDPRPPLFMPDPFLMDQGNYHTADLAYLMNTLQGIPILRTPTQNRLSEQLISYWATFARTGDPNSADAPRWQRGARPDVFTWTSDGSEPRSGFATTHRCNLWRDLR